MLLGDHAGDGNYTDNGLHSSSDPCTSAEELFITYFVQIIAKFKPDLQPPSQKGQSDGLAVAAAPRERQPFIQLARLAFGKDCKVG